MGSDLKDFKRDLGRVYWIGGSARGGKTTVARAIAEEFGLLIYSVDEKWDDHVNRGDSERHPAMARSRDQFRSRDIQSIYQDFPVAILVEHDLKFFIEQFDMIVEDLRCLPQDKHVVVEGSQLLPEQVIQVTDSDKAVWLVSTERFEREMRPWEDQKAEPWFNNLIEASTRRKALVVSQAERLGLRIIVTDGSRKIEDTVDLVKSHFGLNSG